VPATPAPAPPQVVEQEIHKCKRLTADAGGAPPVASGSPNPSAHGRAPGRSAHDALATELVLTDLIGAGGFGAVWRGSWKKVTAAIKVRPPLGLPCFSMRPRSSRELRSALTTGAACALFSAEGPPRPLVFQTRPGTPHSTPPPLPAHPPMCPRLTLAPGDV
jgi:hypothetical protein